MKTSVLKRIISVILVLLMLPGSLTLAFATAEEYTSGNYTYTLSAGKATIVSYPETSKGIVNIPSYLDGYQVSSIGDYSFYACTLITGVVIPDTVTSIGNYAFAYCTTVSTIQIPGSVTSIGKNAFKNSNNVVFNCEKGSYAEQYALENGIRVSYTPYEDEKIFKLRSVSEADICYDYTFSDSYFDQSAYTYNTKLMQLSLCFAVSAMVNDGGPYEGKKPEVAEKFFDDIDFDYFSPFGYDIKPASEETDSIACVIGSKNIEDEDTTIIAVAVRGGGYEGEWGSNFNVGKTTNHSGFYYASQHILNYLNTFISTYGSKFKPNVKFWITGYSRAAATANLVSASLDKGVSSDFSFIKSLSYKPDGVYSYTFETPRNTTDNNARATLYGNIFNIVNRIDPVPRVAPEVWKYDRYGVDYFLPNAEKSGYGNSKAKMEKMYTQITNGDKYKENFVYAYIEPNALLNPFSSDFWNNNVIKENRSVSQGVYLDNLVNVLADDILQGRNTYVKNYQSSFVKFFKNHPLKFDNIPSGEILWNNLKEEINFKLLWELFVNRGDVAKMLRPALARAISNWLSEDGITYNEAYNLLGIIDDAGIAILENINLLLSTVYNQNFSRLFIPHYTSTTFAWVMACPDEITRDSTYAKAKFNCPVDVNVYDVNGNLVASIINDEAQYVDGSFISAYIDLDGQKVFCLPDDEIFFFDVLGTDIGTMSCSFSEYDFALNEETISENYYNIPIDSSTIINATLSEYVEETATINVVVEEDGNEIPSSETVNTESAERFTIEVLTESDIGTTIGGGEYIKGEFAQVSAYESEGSTFIGWFVDGNLVSEAQKYRFMVDKSVTIVGRFIGNTHSVSDLIVSPSTTEINYGDSIILYANIHKEDLPDGAYVKWSKSNSNFDMIVSEDGLTCKISPKSNGKTVFTATVYDKDGNVISSDTQEMTAKAGLWQKIVAFFKKIFGLTKTIPEAFKGIL